MRDTLRNLKTEIRLFRNGRPFKAVKQDLGKLSVGKNSLVFGDSEGLEMFEAVSNPSGEYTVSVYVWDHLKIGSVNALVTVRLHDCRARWVSTIVPNQKFAPHLDGLPVDSGSIAVSSGADSIVIESGLGDGLYDLYRLRSLWGKTIGFAIDFKIWNVRKTILREGWIKDEYGINYLDPERQVD